MTINFSEKELEELQDILTWSLRQAKTDGLYMRIMANRNMITKKLHEYHRNEPTNTETNTTTTEKSETSESK